MPISPSLIQSNATTVDADTRIWIVVGLWGVIFATILGEGLYAFIDGHWAWGISYAVVGVVGVIAVDQTARGKRLVTLYPPEHRASATRVATLALVVTWMLLGFDIYSQRPIATTPVNESPISLPSLSGNPSPLPSLPSVAAPQNTPAGDHGPRIFTDATPDYLIQIYNEHTDVQASHLVQPYIGKWMKVEGVIEQVSTEPFGGGAFVLIAHDKHLSGVPMLVALRFKPDWLDRVSSLVKGDRIEAVGRLQIVQPNGLTLNECEFQFGHNGK